MDVEMDMDRYMLIDAYGYFYVLVDVNVYVYVLTRTNILIYIFLANILI